MHVILQVDLPELLDLAGRRALRRIGVSSEFVSGIYGLNNL